MAGTVQLGGLASGLDTASLVDKLVSANSGSLVQLKTRAAQLRAGAATFSDISKSLSALQTAAAALANVKDAAGFSATSSSTNVDISATGEAQPGAYQINVTSLAAEQRTYSSTFNSNSTALNQSGTFTIQIGTKSANISVAVGDTLQDVAAKVNASGMRVSSSVFYDGSSYRLQIRGLDSGGANALAFTENGTAFDLNGAGQDATRGKTVQLASDAQLTIDGFAVTRSTNEISGAIQGVTLKLKDTTTTAATVTVAADASTVSTKISAFVSAYNAVVQSAHNASGYGSKVASNPALAGDSALRSLTDRLASTVGGVYGDGAYTTLATIGVGVNRDGTMVFDTTKYNKAVAADPSNVQKVLARQTGASSGGAMATVKDLIDGLTKSTTGLISARQSSLTDSASKLDKQADSQQSRLDKYRSNLEKQFSAMEISYSASQQLMAQLGRQFG